MGVIASFPTRPKYVAPRVLTEGEMAIVSHIVAKRALKTAILHDTKNPLGGITHEADAAAQSEIETALYQSLSITPGRLSPDCFRVLYWTFIHHYADARLELTRKRSFA